MEAAFLCTPERFPEVELMPSRLFPLLVLITLLVFAAGCAFADSGVIEAGDRVRVTVLGADDLCGEVSVYADGNVTMPIVGVINVAGKTVEQAAADLKPLVRKYVKDPQVTVQIVQKAPSVVVLSGRVKKPAVYSIDTHTTLLELVGLAGGQDTNADLSAVSIVHTGNKPTETIDLQSFIDGKQAAPNPTLTNGDIVNVPEKVAIVGTVFLLGEVKRIGPYDLRQGLRIHEVISEAGGITDMADPQTATIKSSGAKDSQKFDLVKALAQDPVEDRLLVSGDTITILPTTGTFNVYGAVNRPGSYPIKQKLPLMDALAMAGGYTAHAKIQNARILRSSQQQSIPINLADVEKTKAENMAILPGDTIVVPERGEKASIWQVLSTVGSLGWLIF